MRQLSKRRPRRRSPATALAIGERQEVVCPAGEQRGDERRAAPSTIGPSQQQRPAPSCGAFGVGAAWPEERLDQRPPARSRPSSALPITSDERAAATRPSPPTPAPHRSPPWRGSRAAAAARTSKRRPGAPPMKVTGMRVAQAAELGDVARAGLVVDAAGDQEQRGLVERVGDEIEHRRRRPRSSGRCRSAAPAARARRWSSAPASA